MWVPCPLTPRCNSVLLCCLCVPYPCLLWLLVRRQSVLWLFSVCCLFLLAHPLTPAHSMCLLLGILLSDDSLAYLWLTCAAAGGPASIPTHALLSLRVPAAAHSSDDDGGVFLLSGPGTYSLLCKEVCVCVCVFVLVHFSFAYTIIFCPPRL